MLRLVVAADDTVAELRRRQKEYVKVGLLSVQRQLQETYVDDVARRRLKGAVAAADCIASMRKRWKCHNAGVASDAFL